MPSMTRAEKRATSCTVVNFLIGITIPGLEFMGTIHGREKNLLLFVLFFFNKKTHEAFDCPCT